MNKILFILDRAHGKNTKGKSSIDGSFKEWIWSDKFIDELKEDLSKLNIPFVETVTEDVEVGLSERVRRANRLSKNTQTPILLSFHNNAGGGNGIEVFTSPGEDESDKIARIIATNLINDFPNCKWRRTYPNELDKEAMFTVIAGNKNVKPKYLSVLIEFLFMDNDSDLKKLKDEKYTKRFKESILYSIFELCKKYGYYEFTKWQ